MQGERLGWALVQGPGFGLTGPALVSDSTASALASSRGAEATNAIHANGFNVNEHLNDKIARSLAPVVSISSNGKYHYNDLCSF